MDNRTVMTSDSHQGTLFSSANRGGSLTLEFLYAVCIFHMKKVYAFRISSSP